MNRGSFNAACCSSGSFPAVGASGRSRVRAAPAASPPAPERCRSGHARAVLESDFRASVRWRESGPAVPARDCSISGGFADLLLALRRKALKLLVVLHEAFLLVWRHVPQILDPFRRKPCLGARIRLARSAIRTRMPGAILVGPLPLRHGERLPPCAPRSPALAVLRPSGLRRKPRQEPAQIAKMESHRFTCTSPQETIPAHSRRNDRASALPYGG